MCVSPDNVRAMFGDGAVKGECGTASQGNEHYCTCTSNECNRLPLHDQVSFQSKRKKRCRREQLPSRLREIAPSQTNRFLLSVFLDPDQSLDYSEAFGPPSLSWSLNPHLNRLHLFPSLSRSLNQYQSKRYQN